MQTYLEEKGVTEVDVVGLAFDYCVGSTARDAAKAGFKTRILMEGTKSISSETQ